MLALDLGIGMPRTQKAQIHHKHLTEMASMDVDCMCRKCPLQLSIPGHSWPENCSPTETSSTYINTTCLLVQLHQITLTFVKLYKMKQLAIRVLGFLHQTAQCAQLQFFLTCSCAYFSFIISPLQSDPSRQSCKGMLMVFISGPFIMLFSIISIKHFTYCLKGPCVIIWTTHTHSQYISLFL